MNSLSNSIKEEIAQYLQQFLISRRAKYMAKGYRIRPIEAMGDIYLKLCCRIPDQLRNLEVWVLSNSKFHLQNYLNREKISRISLEDVEK